MLEYAGEGQGGGVEMIRERRTGVCKDIGRNKYHTGKMGEGAVMDGSAMKQKEFMRKDENGDPRCVRKHSFSRQNRSRKRNVHGIEQNAKKKKRRGDRHEGERVKWLRGGGNQTQVLRLVVAKGWN